MNFCPSSKSDPRGHIKEESTSTDMSLGTTIHNTEITLRKGRQLARAVDEIGAESLRAKNINILYIQEHLVHLMKEKLIL